MIQQVKTVFATSQCDFQEPERLGFVVTWILSEALKKIDSAFAYHVAAGAEVVIVSGAKKI